MYKTKNFLKKEENKNKKMKKSRKLIALLITFAMLAMVASAFVFTGCPTPTTSGGGDDTYTVTAVNIEGTGLTATNRTLNMTLGATSPANQAGTRQLTAAVVTNPEDAEFAGTVVWSSSNDAIATVTQGGLVEARATGSATIRATVDTVYSEVSVNATLPAATGITITPAAATVANAHTLILGGGTNASLQLEATVNPANPHLSSDVTWSVESVAPYTNVVTVVNGLVTATGTGRAIVRATSVQTPAISQVAHFNVLSPATDMIFSPGNLTLFGGDTYVVFANALPGEALGTVTWSTTGAAAVSINATGTITVAPGVLTSQQVATVTATAGALSRSFTVTVPAGAKPEGAITTLADWSAINDNLVAGGGVQGNFFLMNDLDFGGATIPAIGDNAFNATHGFYAFNGTLDGRGRAIMNFTTTPSAVGDGGNFSESIFGGTGPLGVIRNLSVINATVDGNRSGLLVGSHRGLVENVFVEGQVIATGTATYGRSGTVIGTNGGIVRNVVAVVTSGAEVWTWGTPYLTPAGTWTNVFLVGDNIQSDHTGTPANRTNSHRFNMADIAGVDFSELPATNWNLVAGQLPTLRNLGNPLMLIAPTPGAGFTFSGPSIANANQPVEFTITVDGNTHTGIPTVTYTVAGATRTITPTNDPALSGTGAGPQAFTFTIPASSATADMTVAVTGGLTERVGNSITAPTAAVASGLAGAEWRSWTGTGTTSTAIEGDAFPVATLASGIGLSLHFGFRVLPADLDIYRFGAEVEFTVGGTTHTVQSTQRATGDANRTILITIPASYITGALTIVAIRPLPYTAAAWTRITTAAQFNSMSNNGFYYLAADIDFEGGALVPRGGTAATVPATGIFTGVFDGRGFALKNFTFSAAGNWSPNGWGVFRRTDGAIIRNLALDGFVKTAATAGQHGVLVGSADNTLIENIFIRGTINRAAGGGWYSQSAGVAGRLGAGTQLRNAITQITTTSNAHGIAARSQHGALQHNNLFVVTDSLSEAAFDFWHNGYENTHNIGNGSELYADPLHDFEANNIRAFAIADVAGQAANFAQMPTENWNFPANALPTLRHLPPLSTPVITAGVQVQGIVDLAWRNWLPGDTQSAGTAPARFTPGQPIRFGIRTSVATAFEAGETVRVEFNIDGGETQYVIGNTIIEINNRTMGIEIPTPNTAQIVNITRIYRAGIFGVSIAGMTTIGVTDLSWRNWLDGDTQSAGAAPTFGRIGQPIRFGIRTSTATAFTEGQALYVHYTVDGVAHYVRATTRIEANNRTIGVEIPAERVTGNIVITRIQRSGTTFVSTAGVDITNVPSLAWRNWLDGNTQSAGSAPTSAITGQAIRFGIRAAAASPFLEGETLRVEFTVGGVAHHVIGTTRIEANNRTIGVEIPANLVTGADIVITSIARVPAP